MPQTTYPVDPAAAIAGQIVNVKSFSGRYECSEIIEAGRAVALHTDGKLRNVRSGDKILGFAPYRAALPAGGYQIGDMMPVVRIGQMWVQTVGTAPTATALQSPNVSASTTIATDRGKLTGAATSATVGAEIVASPEATECVKVSTGIALVNFSYPA